MTRVRRTGAVLVTLAALTIAALGSTAETFAHAAVPGGEAAPSPKAATTHLTVNVSGCHSCSVRLVHAIQGGAQVWDSKRKRIGSDATVSFVVPTRRTHGMSLELRAPWEGDVGFVHNVVTRYRGFAPGEVVTRDDARAAHNAEGCWAGTSRHHATLDLVVKRVRGRTVTGKKTEMPLVFAPQALRSWKPMVSTYHGTIGNQDAFYCKRPSS